MRKIILLWITILATSLIFGQNTFPSDGNVGIGTTIPIGKLDVFTGLSGNTFNLPAQLNGTISFCNSNPTFTAPTIASKSNSDRGLILISATSDTNPVPDMVFDIRENDNTNYSTLTTGGFRFQHAGTSLIDILRNGNVLIGTTADNGANKLQVSGSISTKGDTYANSNIVVERTVGAIGKWGLGVQNINNQFGIQDLAQGGLSRLVIAPNGNVLMGTTTDNGTNKLQVSGSISTKGDTYANSNIVVERTTGAIGKWGLGVQNLNNQFGIQDLAQGSLTRLVIDPNGNVGIGSTSPDSKLTVKGKNSRRRNKSRFISSCRLCF